MAFCPPLTCLGSSRSHAELESIQEVLSDYRQCHGALIQWIEEITVQQELMKPGQAEDSRVLSEQLSQQTVRQDLGMSPWRGCCSDLALSFLVLRSFRLSA